MNLLELLVKIKVDDQASKTLNEFGGKVSNIAKAGAVALGALGISSIKTGMDFDAAMSQVAATMGYTTAELSDGSSEASQNMAVLTEFAKEMGKTTAFSATQASEALNYMALAGYDVETSMSMLPTVLDLAAAGSMDLASASDMVTDAQSALGLNIDQTRTMVDQMAAASSKTNTSVEQLGSAFLTVGGTAKSLSGGTRELATVLGILADNGIKGSEGGTALRNVLLAIQGDKFEKTFGALGVSAYDASGELRPMQDILADMNTVMDGMTTEEKTNLIANTFNARDLKSVNALLATTSDRWDQVTDAIENSDGAAAHMAETQLDNLKGSLTIMQSAFEGLQIAFSDKVAPAIRTAVDGLASTFSFLTDVLSSDEAEFVAIRGVLSAIIPVVTGLTAAFATFAMGLKIEALVSAVTKALTAFKAAQKATTVAQAALNAVMNANPFVLIASAIALVTAALVALYMTNEDFRNAVDGVIGMLQGALAPVLEAAKAAFESLAGKVMGAASAIGEAIMPLLQQLGEAFTAAMPLIEASFTAAMDAILAVASVVWPAIEALISTVLGVITGIVQAATAVMSGDWSGFLEGMRTIASSVMQGVKALIENALHAVSGVISSIMASIGGSWNSAWQSVKETLKGAWDGMKQAVKDAADKVYEFVKDLPNRIMAIFTGAGSWLRDAGKQIIDGLLNGIKGGIDAVKDTLNGLTSLIPDWKGPADVDSKLLVESGQLIMDGLMDGIDSRIGDLRGTLGEVTGEIEDWDYGSVGAGIGHGASASRGNNVDTLIEFLQWFLPRAIRDNAPSMTLREFNRTVRGAVA